ncbi:MAG: response regulator [Candidatus Omnitrophica bacterium]|nr:response regulator [Candidatus Omnitrophota bacterium]MCB9747632.1 response regulator [Candidatus Omnitrophota bacterium]
MTNIKILMADDEEDILGIMAKKIAAEGYEVVTAKDGREAWEKIEAEDPDVVLLDINMPELDGFQVLKKLRENPPSTKWQPVIIISARRELDDLKKGYSLEADHYITKPCQVSDILKAIKLMLNLKSQRKTI